jgi:hypothetical protein
MKNNNPYVGGIPDVWYSSEMGDLWIEYKYLPSVPKRAVVKIDLSPLQAQWLKERYNEGRNVAVIVGCPLGGVLFKNLDWEDEIAPQKFVQKIVDRKRIASLIVSNLRNNHGDSITEEYLQPH